MRRRIEEIIAGKAAKVGYYFVYEGRLTYVTAADKVGVRSILQQLEYPDLDVEEAVTSWLLSASPGTTMSYVDLVVIAVRHEE